MDQQKRLFITIALCMGVLMVHSYFFGVKPTPYGAHVDGGTPPAEVAQANPAATPPVAAAEATDGGEPGDGGTATAAATPPVNAPEKLETFSSPATELTFSSRGGGLTRAVVKGGGTAPEYKFERRTKQGDSQAIDLVKLRAGQPHPAAIALKGELALPYSATWELERKDLTLTMRTAAPGVTVEKIFQLGADSYETRVNVKVTNTSDAPKKATLALSYSAWVDPASEEKGGFFSPPPEISQVACRHETSTTNLAFKKESSTESHKGPVKFVGFDERYFLGAIFPRFADGTSCTLAVDGSGARSAELEVDLGSLAPGQSVSREFGLYLGPKSLTELRKVSEENAGNLPILTLKDLDGPLTPASAGFDPELTQAIDFGWWAVICTVLLKILKLFQKVFVNWGIAIILLTVLIKAALYPLTKKSMESMEAMKRLQPKMDELKKKHETDKEKLNQEVMRLYQEHKVNPFGGCLPMLLQMPVWIALYRTLLTSFELYREPLLPIWISDLTSADPFYILPLAMGVTMFITQKMQPQMGDPAQARMMLYFMPIFFTFIMMNLPAGLTLYIFTNNLLSIAQQKYLQAQMRKRAAAA